MARSVRKELRLTPELESRVKSAKGDVSFNRFVEKALEAALNGGAVPDGVRSSVRPVDVPAASPRAPR
jgi:hypothetical protein